VLFAVSIPLEAIFLLDLKKEVRAVIVEHACLSLPDSGAVLVHLGLYEVCFLGYYLKDSVDVLQFKCRLLKKSRRQLMRGTLRRRIYDSGVDKPG
jgi:hypothetical protein